MTPGLQPVIACVLSFLGALILSLVTIPRIIFVAKKKRLFDVPDNNRKIHREIIPNLGGIAIFFAFMIITALLIKPSMFGEWNYFAAACLILLVTGIKDDLVSIPPYKKFLSQFCAAFIIVYWGNIRITSLHGILGVHDLPEIASISFSVIGCMFMTNAFNLIDGIDGLAGTIGVFACFAFGVFLYAEGKYSVAVMSFSLMGAIAGFLRYNYSPARIFMGDTGSMIIGFSISVIAIMFIKTFDPVTTSTLAAIIHKKESSLIVALSLLFIPIFDTFRVFTTRSLKGHSPFRADRTHLHHYLLDLGFSHTRTVSILFVANMFIICVSLIVQDYNINLAIGSMLLVAFGLFGILFYLRHKLNPVRRHEDFISINGGKTSISSTPANNRSAGVKEPGMATAVQRKAESVEVSNKAK